MIRSGCERSLIASRFGPDRPNLNLHVRNFRHGRQKHRIEIHAPPDVIVEPGVLEGTLAGESRRSFPVRVTVPAEAAPGTRIVALDMTLNGSRYGEWFDFIVGVGIEGGIRK